MKIRFDYYTTNTSALSTAMAIADQMNLSEMDIRRITDYDGKSYWNIMGEIDHNEMVELFDLFEQFNFTSDADQL